MYADSLNGSMVGELEEQTTNSKSLWLAKASQLIDFTEESLETVDRVLNVNEGDILVCETTCLSYALHVLKRTPSVKEVWAVPPQKSGEWLSDESLNEFEEVFSGANPALLKSLKGSEGTYRGITADLPSCPFKLFITTQYCGVPIDSAINWPLYNAFWVAMLNTEGATGAVLYPPIVEQSKEVPSLRSGNIEGDYRPGDFANVIELPSGHILLGVDASDSLIHMEDLSDVEKPWVREVTQMEFAINDACLVPSMVRRGVEIVGESTLGELARRISRGTTLSEKDLDIKERLKSRVAERSDSSTASLPNGGTGVSAKRRGWGMSSGAYTLTDKWVYPLEDDLYYVDGSCFNKGEIWPAVLGSMPKGQDRYIVDERDGEVILVSRNSKEPAVYKAIRPTLIGNSVFVIRTETNVNKAYLACWMRGWLAKSLMHNEGKILSKGVLDRLPVPILEDDVMERVVRYERSIDEKVFRLREEIGKLESSNRFAPLAAIEEDGSEVFVDE